MKKYADTAANLLAGEIARMLGGLHVAVDGDGGYYENFAEVEVAEYGNVPAYNVSVRLPGYAVNAHKATISLTPATFNHDVRWKGISATMDTRRAIDALMVDISRRVVNAPGAIEALREYEAKVAERKAREEGVKGYVAALEKLPNFKSSNNFPPTAYEGRVFSSGGIGFEARINAEGSVHFDRIGSMTNDQARRVIAILGETVA